jgi:hypothetical protein
VHDISDFVKNASICRRASAVHPVVVAVSTVAVAGMRTAIGHATNVKASAALGTDFDRRSLTATYLHVKREANEFVTECPGNAWRGLSHGPHSRLLLCRSRSFIVAQRRPTLATRRVGQGQSSMAPLDEAKCQRAPKIKRRAPVRQDTNTCSRNSCIATSAQNEYKTVALVKRSRLRPPSDGRPLG